jgi:hypothetical protein
MHAPDPYALYAPPAAPPVYRQNVFVPEGARTAPLLGSGLRVAKLVLGIVQTLLLLVGTGLLVTGVALGVRGEGETVLVIGGITLALWWVAVIAFGVVSMVWAHKFWSWIPPEHRHTSLWKKYISPRQAVGFMLIPYFNIFWVIVINLGTADILERMRVEYPTDKPSAKTIALITTIVPFVFFPASPFVDYFFDKHVEGMAADMQAHMTARAGLGQATGGGGRT